MGFRKLRDGANRIQFNQNKAQWISFTVSKAMNVRVP